MATRLLNFGDYPISRGQTIPPPTVAADGADVSAINASIGTAHRTISTDTTISASDSAIFVDASAGPVAITLPTISARRFTVKKVDGSANAVTISGPANIDGSASIALNSQYESVTLGGGTSEWFIL